MAISILRMLVLVNIALVATAAVLPRLAPGAQFITGACTSDADCGSGCCGFNTGKCAGAVIAQERDGGCGFGDAFPNNNAAQKIQGSHAEAASGVKAAAAGADAAKVAPTPAAAALAAQAPPSPAATSPATTLGSHFITSACSSDADCASGCCGFKSGKCAGPVIAQERDGGCGFGDASPNNNAAQKIQGPKAEAAPGVKADATGAGAAEAAPAPALTTAAAPAPAPAPTSPAASPGSQFITGVCSSDADCASGCCGFKSGKCAGPVIAQERDGGCGFGDPSPNNNAAQKITGPNAEAAPGVKDATATPVANGSPAASTGSGKPPGTQFITGDCGGDGDCVSGCCSVGKCAALLVATGPGGKGCGFVAAKRGFHFLTDLD